MSRSNAGSTAEASTRFNGVVISVLAVLMLVMTVGFILLERRFDELDEFVERTTFEPARSYERVDLEALAAEEHAPDEVAVRKTVYVPVYSHVFFQQGRPYLLEGLLSIRNGDLERPLYVSTVEYYDTNGELVRAEIDRVIRIGPLATVEFLVPARDTSGGTGANYIVDWYAIEEIEPPIIEVMMVGAAGGHAISFRTEGRELGRSGHAQSPR